jgi:hypothetical protein
VLNWVRFHAQLRQGEKRGIPRAWRFVYMELSHEARERGGWVAIPAGMSDVDGVRELLGGNRKEVSDAIAFFTAGEDPALSFGEVAGKRAIIVNNWRKWNPKSDDSSSRVKDFREREREAKEQECNVTETVTVTEEKPGVTPRARALISSPLVSSDLPLLPSPSLPTSGAAVVAVPPLALVPSGGRKPRALAVVTPDVQAVFDHWLAIHVRRRQRKGAAPRLSDERARAIAARLAEGFTVAELKLAAEGIWTTGWNIGDNPEGKQYTDIELAMRDAKHVEDFSAAAVKAAELDRPKEVAQ